MIRSTEVSPDAAPTKYAVVARDLTTRIHSGEWADGRIPTVRDIAEEYAVSTYTASKALQVLQDQGLVVTKDRSGCFVAPTVPAPTTLAPPQVDRWAVVLRVSPGPWRQASEAASQVGFDRVVAEDRVPFVAVRLEIDPADGNTVPAAAVAAAADAGAKGVILLPARVSDAAQAQDEAFLAGCRRAGLPVVLVDRNLRGPNRPLEHDLVASDHFDGGRACTQHLLDLGRTRVACVVASPTSSHADRLAGYLFALGAARLTGGGEYPPVVLRPPPGMDARDAYGWLADRVVAERCDGVICYQDYTAVGLILELLLRGISVPKDVAVVGCDDLPIGNTFSLGVTTYAYPAAEIARWAVRLAANRRAHPTDPPVKLLLPGRLIVRNSSRAGG